DPDDIQRCRLELRWRAAGLRVYRKLGAHWAGYSSADQISRLQHLQHGLQPAELLGSDSDLPLFSDPAHGVDHDAGSRWAEAGVARGLRHSRRELVSVLALH